MNTQPSKPRQFIILTDDFPPCSGGGIASWALGLAERLSCMGHEVHVLTRRRKSSKNVGNSHAFKTIYVKGRDWNQFRWLYMLIRTFPLLRRLHHPVVLASTWQHLEGIVFLRPWFEFKVICFAHAQDITKTAIKHRRRLKRVMNRVDLLAPVSRYLEGFIRENFVDLDINTSVIHNGVDSDKFKPLPEKDCFKKEYDLEGRFPVLLTVARTTRMKGIHQVIQSMPSVLQVFPGAIYLIAGLKKEPEYSSLLSMIRQLGIEQSVRFLSSVDYERLPELYNACDIFVLASVPVHKSHLEQDNFPLVILEACACEIPVVTTNCAGIAEAIDDGKNGIIVPLDNLCGLADGLIRLALDAPLRKRLGAQGRKRIVSQFTEQQTAFKLFDQVEVILRKNR